MLASPGYDNPVVVQLVAELSACAGLHGQLDAMAIMAARYQVGQHWKSSIGSQAGIVAPPKVTRENPIVTANMIAALVRQWTGRLNVSDFTAGFEPRDAKPESHLTARMLQRWYNYWVRESGVEGWYNDLSFARVVIGSAVGTWYFDPDQPGGVGLSVLHPGRLTIDPANRNWELEEHETVIQSDALSSGEARRRYGLYFDNDKPFQSDARLSTLRAVESYVGSALYGIQPGAADSIATGVIVHRRFSQRYKRLHVVIENPSPTWQEKGKKRAEFFVARPPEGAERGEDDSWIWRWGCPYLKLDCFQNIAVAFGNGLVVELIPAQNLLNMAKRCKLGALLSRAHYYMVAYKGTLENEAALRGPPGSVILLKKGFKDKLIPSFIAPPRYDGAADNLDADAQALMQALSHITPTLQGQAAGKRGDVPYAAYELLRQQGLVPLEAVALRDRDRTSKFMNRVARAALDHYGRTDPGYLANIIGHSFGSRRLGQVASRSVLKGPTSCVMRRDAFLPQTAQEKEARLMTVAAAGGGKVDPTFANLLFEQTGYPLVSGQAEAYQQAYEIARRVIADEKDSQIFIDDDLEVMLRVIDQTMRQRVTMELSPEAIGRLQAAKTQCLTLMAKKKAVEASLSGMTQTLGGPSEELPEPVPAQGAPGGAMAPLEAVA